MKKDRRTGDKVKFTCDFLFQLLRFQENFPCFFLICKSHHLRTISHLIVACTGTASVKQIQKIFFIFFCHMIIRRSFFKKKIQIFPIHTGNASSVSRLLHSALYFQRSNSRFYNFRQNFNGADIFQA